jgi:hypothetical protein
VAATILRPDECSRSGRCLFVQARHLRRKRGRRAVFWDVRSPFSEAISSNHVQWVSDEEFDDSSYVLQFEDENEVRLVAFTGTPDFRYEPASLRDVSLSQNEFYWILQLWRDRFKDEWTSLPKVPGSQGSLVT